MIEGLVGGGEPEERETEETNSRVETETTALATIVAMDAARYDPELSRKAGEYLDRQNDLVLALTALVKLQVHHFEALKHAQNWKQMKEARAVIDWLAADCVITSQSRWRSWQQPPGWPAGQQPQHYSMQQLPMVAAPMIFQPLISPFQTD
ncbi:hypothetical protein AAKU67_003159 [Oxalobacteraceae bacterium GrIS 2.11]